MKTNSILKNENQFRKTCFLFASFYVFFLETELLNQQIFPLKLQNCYPALIYQKQVWKMEFKKIGYKLE